jgi:hypothetical protein
MPDQFLTIWAKTGEGHALFILNSLELKCNILTYKYLWATFNQIYIKVISGVWTMNKHASLQHQV